MATTTVSLYSLEETLMAYAETMEMVEPEQEQAFLADFTAALKAAVEKRDSVARFLAHLESQQELGHLEIDRIRDRVQSLKKVQERIESYVRRSIEALGFDRDGDFKKLAGNTVTFSLRACPPSVEILDGDLVPDEYKTLVLKMPAKLWEQIADLVEEAELAELVRHGVELKEVLFDRLRIKQELDADRDVPGAELRIGNYNLVRK
jgi:hypothetical protein